MTSDNATMSNRDLAIVILAAGKGTRLKSGIAKVLHRAGGRALVEHVFRACAPLKVRKTIAVVGHQAEEVAAVVEPLGAETVLQEPQHGTGHAMQVARRTPGGGGTIGGARAAGRGEGAAATAAWDRARHASGAADAGRRRENRGCAAGGCAADPHGNAARDGGCASRRECRCDDPNGGG